MTICQLLLNFAARIYTAPPALAGRRIFRNLTSTLRCQNVTGVVSYSGVVSNDFQAKLATFNKLDFERYKVICQYACIAFMN